MNDVHALCLPESRQKPGTGADFDIDIRKSHGKRTIGAGHEYLLETLL
jgi:hypothetical protein